MNLPKFHHGLPKVDLNLDDEWIPSDLESLGLQLAFVAVLAGIVWLFSYEWRSQPHTYESDAHLERKSFEGYRNYVGPTLGRAENGTLERVYPGNPSEWYLVTDLPLIKKDKLKNDYSKDSKTKKHYVAMAGKVFDVSVGLTGLVNCATESVEGLYGNDITYAATKGLFNDEMLGKALEMSGNTTKTPLSDQERSNFFTTYNHLYVTYPIVGLLPVSEEFNAFLRNRSKFDRPNYFW